MTSSTEDVAVAASNSSATSTKQANADMDRMTQILLHEERSCIFETRVERADLCRQRGSAQFKIGNVDEAIKWYERALYHVDFDEGTWHFEFTPRNRADVNVVRLPVYLNLAACFLVQGAPKDGKQDEQILAKVIENANLALAIDSDNDKALYRAGYALLLTGDLANAKEKLTKAANNRPTDKKIRNAMILLNQKLADQKKEEKKRWGGRLLKSKTPKNVEGACQQQVTKSSESNSVLVTIAIVLLGIVLALGQLNFVE